MNTCKSNNNSLKRSLFILAILMSLSLSCMAGDYVVKMKRKSGVYTIPCWVNGLKGDFIFDTGAANTSLSQEFVNELLRRKLLSQSDFTGAIQTRNASGVIDNNTTIHIKQLKLGNRIIYNVRAIVATSQKAPLLLGLNVIDLLGEWSMNNKGHLTLHGPESVDVDVEPAIVDTLTGRSDITPLPDLTSTDTSVTTPDLKVRAYKGDPIAQYAMGMNYLTGDGVDSDPKVAIFWLQLSAAQNYRPAQLQLANCLEKGLGVDINSQQAEYWRRKAFDDGWE